MSSATEKSSKAGKKPAKSTAAKKVDAAHPPSSLEKPLRAALKRKAYLQVAECLDALNLIKWKASQNLLRRQHRRKVPRNQRRKPHLRKQKRQNLSKRRPKNLLPRKQQKKPAKKATPKKAEKTKSVKK